VPSQNGALAVCLHWQSATRLGVSSLNWSGVNSVPLCEPSQYGWFFDCPHRHHQYEPACSSNTAGFLSAMCGSLMVGNLAHSSTTSTAGKFALNSKCSRVDFRLMKRMLVILGVGLASGLTARACDLCGAYCACSPAGPKSSWVVGVFEQYTDYSTLQEDGHNIRNPYGQYLRSSITQFIGGYQYHDWLEVQVALPYIYRAYRGLDGTTVQQGSVSGIGDMTLVGSVRVFEKKTDDSSVRVSLLGGLKFPTVNTSELKDAANEPEPPPGSPPNGIGGHDLALGSGSWDGIVGDAFFARWKRWYGAAALQYAIRSEGAYNYQYANDLTWSTGPGFLLWQGARFARTPMQRQQRI
jgi:hypothetical protein